MDTGKHDYTLCLKKCTNFETVQLKITKIDFDDIWQKYSKLSRIGLLRNSVHLHSPGGVVVECHVTRYIACKQCSVVSC